MGQAPIRDSVRAWKPAVAGIREVLHATFRDHAYPLHTHDTWTVFIVDAGAIRYDLDRHEHHAESARVSLLPPHVVHDGRPGANDGYRKRVLYIETSVLGESLIGGAVDRPSVPDPRLRGAVSDLHDALACPDDAFEAGIRFAFVAEGLRAALGSGPPPPALAPSRAADGLRAWLDAHLFDRPTIAAAADAVGTGPTHLARSFTEAFGIAPHRYVAGRRLDAARDRILKGQPLADVAAEVGFTDQAHLTRGFRRFLGTTPGAFARAARTGRRRVS